MDSLTAFTTVITALSSANPAVLITVVSVTALCVVATCVWQMCKAIIKGKD
jgi:hypothetical protein